MLSRCIQLSSLKSYIKIKIVYMIHSTKTNAELDNTAEAGNKSLDGLNPAVFPIKKGSMYTSVGKK